MPHFDIIRIARPAETFRVKSVMGTYDLQTNKTTEHFVGDINLPAEWNIGLIVGRSGTGKTTIARELFGDCIVDAYEYTHESILDDMPKDATVTEITQALSSVGFASPPSWLKSYSMLSNGEKMRCDLARAMLEKRDVFCFDEFTSVVDRTVAKVGAFAIQKAIRKNGRKFIAVTCHADVEAWLMPDWVFNTDTMQFSVKDLAEQKKNRPAIRLDIVRLENGTRENKIRAWAAFRKYHYLSDAFNIAATAFLVYAEGQLAAFTSYLPFPHPVKKNAKRLHRTVVFPDYQGIGIAKALTEVVCRSLHNEGKSVITTTSNPARIATLKKSPDWKCTYIGRLSAECMGIEGLKKTMSGRNRITASFEYFPKIERENYRLDGENPLKRK